MKQAQEIYEQEMKKMQKGESSKDAAKDILGAIKAPNAEKADPAVPKEKKKESTWKKNWNEEDITKKENPKYDKSEAAIQRARAFARKHGYSTDGIQDFGNGQVMLLYYNPRTGESGGEYFYY